MGKASRLKQESARQKIAAQRAAAQRAERRRRLVLIGGSIVVVLAVIGTLVGIKLSSSGSSGSGSVTGTALPASVSRNVTSVPAATLDKVGGGTVTSYVKKPVTAINGAALTSGGKPQMLYIGAEFCPYCAAMRWSMAVALSRFGTLSPLHGIHSAPSPEVYPHTATLTFYKTTFTSKYLTFTPVENETVTHALLQKPTAAQQRLWQRYNPNSYPFIDIGGKYLVTATYSPQVLAGKTWSQISAALHNPSSPIAQAVLGTANYLTAAICKVSPHAPAGVCSASSIKTLQGQL